MGLNSDPVEGFEERDHGIQEKDRDKARLLGFKVLEGRWRLKRVGGGGGGQRG